MKQDDIIIEAGKTIELVTDHAGAWSGSTRDRVEAIIRECVTKSTEAKDCEIQVLREHVEDQTRVIESRAAPASAEQPQSEFYDQRKWREIHRQADDLIATNQGKVLTALYRSPDERLREDYVAFVEMLQKWAQSQPQKERTGEK